MGDDGKLKKEEPKTEEQLKRERLECYQKNPDTFVELGELILACIRNPQSGLGVSVFVGNCKRSELDIAQNELNHIAHKRLISMDIESEMKHQVGKHLIKPAGGIFNFVRGRK